MTDDRADDELAETERRALDAWTATAPPAGFADRVLAARPIAAHGSKPRIRRAALGGAFAAAAAAAAAVFALGGHGAIHTAHGTLSPQVRSTAAIGDRAVIVAEAAAQLEWDVTTDGATTISQPAGDVFYRVDHGGPFVVHTPAGDVHVTGTCFRIEVQMNKPAQMILAGAAGAAIATGVVITVYEGRVVADSHGVRSELQPGTRTTLDPGGTRIALGEPRPDPSAPSPSLDVEHASREQLVARLAAQDAELAKLRAGGAHPGGGRFVEGAGIPFPPDDDRGLGAFPDGRPWHDPSADTLKQWAADCHIRFDEPSFDHPATAGGQLGLTADEVTEYNAAVSGVQQKFTTLVRTLYVATTNDTAGAETLSLDGLIQEIFAKAPPGEEAADRATLAQERAGLIPTPTDTTHEPPLEQLIRAQMALGDQMQAALADSVGSDRAAAIRGDGFGSRHEMSGCPDPSPK